MKPQEEIQNKIDKIKEEVDILNDIQNTLGDNYKLFLKDPVKNELEQFNLLIDKISQYNSPLIRQKFIDIIMRNFLIFQKMKFKN